MLWILHLFSFTRNRSFSNIGVLDHDDDDDDDDDDDSLNETSSLDLSFKGHEKIRFRHKQVLLTTVLCTKRLLSFEKSKTMAYRLYSVVEWRCCKQTETITVCWERLATGDHCSRLLLSVCLSVCPSVRLDLSVFKVMRITKYRVVQK